MRAARVPGRAVPTAVAVPRRLRRRPVLPPAEPFQVLAGPLVNCQPLEAVVGEFAGRRSGVLLLLFRSLISEEKNDFFLFFPFLLFFPFPPVF